MSKLIKEESVAAAWVGAVRHLLDDATDHSDCNLILEIDQPLIVLEAEKDIYRRVDALLKQTDEQSLETVANTIFPNGLYRSHGAAGIFEIYPEQIYPRIKKLKCNKWGTYAHRLVRRVKSDGTEINPLAEVVRRLHIEAATNGPKRSRFELNLVDPFMDLSISDPTLPGDSYSMGGPCLSHLSFKLSADQKVCLVAFYRSHYYVERALGNLIGLSNLMRFAARESGLEVGSLTCISSYATLDIGKGRGLPRIRELVQ